MDMTEETYKKTYNNPNNCDYGIYFPEKELVECFKNKFGIDVGVYCFLDTGITCLS